MDRRINKTGSQRRSSGQNTWEGAGKWRLFYEIYPDLRWQPTDSSVDWFEVALHAEMPGYRPPNHPHSREAVFALVGVADFLIQHIKSPALYSIGRTSPYFTLHPPASGDFTQTRLSRTLSLVFSNVGPYTQLREPSILTEIKNQLSELNVSRFQSSAETICR
jgi:hypothetical protein